MICRLCLKTSQRKEAISIFAECETKWLKLIMKYFDLVLTADDSISTIICNDCSFHLEEFHKFWLYVDEKQGTLHNEFIKIEQCNDNEVKDPAEIEATTEEVEPYAGIAETANEEFSIATNMQSEDLTTDDDTTFLQLRNKSKRRTISAATEIVQTHQLSKEEVFKNANGIVFNEADKLLEHITLHQSSKVFKCNICNIQVLTQENLILHKYTTHSGNEASVCHICNKIFRNKRCFGDHLEWHKNEKAHTCIICGKIFTLRNNMRHHIATIHHKIYPYICVSCGKKFRFRPEYLRHIQDNECIGEESVQSEGARRQLYSCPHCSKEYFSRSNIYKHIKRFHFEEWIKAKLERIKNPYLQRTAN